MRQQRKSQASKARNLQPFPGLLVNHFVRSLHSFSSDGILVVDDRLGEVFGLFALTETQSNNGFSTTLFVRDSNGKESRRITHRLNPVIKVLPRADGVHLAHGKESRRGTFLFVGKDHEQNLSAAFNTETTFLQGFTQIPLVGAVSDSQAQGGIE